jgi:PilZ domain
MAEQTKPSPTKYSKNGPITERRVWVRIPSGQEVSCQPVAATTTDESETAWLGKVRNVSPGGIGLTMNRRFEPGTTLIVELSAKPKGVLRPVPVRVIHATAEKKGRWLIGCTFASPLSPEQLQAFLQE